MYLYKTITMTIVTNAAHHSMRNIIAIHSRAPSKDTHIL